MSTGEIIATILLIAVALFSIWIITLAILRKIDVSRFGFLQNSDLEFLEGVDGYYVEVYETRSVFNDKIQRYRIKNSFGMRIDLGFNLKVYIDEILVAKEDEWMHKIPKEMKQYIRSELKIFKMKNKEHDEIKSNESDMTFKAEQEYLIKKFSKK